MLRHSKTLFSVSTFRPLSFLCLAVFGAGDAVGANWTVTPSLQLTVDYDDNVRLETVSPGSVVETTIIPEASINRSTERSDVTIDATGSYATFSGSGSQDLDGGDVILDLSAYRDNSERTRIGLDGEYIRDSTLTSELETTGEVQERRRRDFAFIMPYWTYAISESSSIKFGYEYTDVSYDNPTSLNLFDYDLNALSATLTRQASEETEFFGTLEGARLEAPDKPEKNDYGSLELGVTRRFSPTLSGFVAVGGLSGDADVASNGVRMSKDISEGLFRAGINRKIPVGELSAEIGRYVEPSGRGLLRRTDRIRVRLKRRLSPTTTFTLTAVILEGQDVVGTDRIEREFYSIKPKISWLVTPTWSLEGAYRYRDQNSPENADSNTVGIGVVYVWPRITASP